MRTTLDIDEDVLAAAKELGRRRKLTAGKVISELSRRALAGTEPGTGRRQARAGFRPFASRGTVVSNALIDRLRDESGT